jgi:RNA polymerase sigma-70 factor (ECF subfamily)
VTDRGFQLGDGVFETLRARAGHPAELAEHVARLRRSAAGLAIHLPDDIEDLVQETLLAVHNQRHTYDPGQPLTAWVHAIARYKMSTCAARGREARTTRWTTPTARTLTRPRAGGRDMATLLAKLPDRHRLWSCT